MLSSLRLFARPQRLLAIMRPPRLHGDRSHAEKNLAKMRAALRAAKVLVQGLPPALAELRAAVALLQTACAEAWQIAEAQQRVDTVLAITDAVLAVWHELAPQAFEARTLTPATASAFAMLCRAVVVERATEIPNADHRGLMARIGTWLKDFGLAPLGKPMYAAEVETKVNPLDRFTKKAGA